MCLGRTLPVVGADGVFPPAAYGRAVKRAGGTLPVAPVGKGVALRGGSVLGYISGSCAPVGGAPLGAG